MAPSGWRRFPEQNPRKIERNSIRLFTGLRGGIWALDDFRAVAAFRIPAKFWIQNH
jgi:hypothetical protein